ncbi:MBL fold metallo-hydrolase [Zavarzinia sp. CC-PAN008]|uniref:MBL fold metallo-hydrolase n=1 Tax=Zavarzinia sp. CC-PAN008 TaxID=3243332 RepID=UPI003F742DAF
MAVEIPFKRDMEFEYGVLAPVAPGLRRIVARNPGPFTYTGTGTYVIGTGKVAVIDPGPDDAAHIQALLAGLDGETVTHILVTHTHMDHSPGAAAVKAATGARTYAFGAHPRTPDGQQGEGGDLDFVPDVTIGHGDVVEGVGWSVEALHTPGHISNHLSFAWREPGVLFSGDHVMAWSTSVVGDMSAYMKSLNLLLPRDDRMYWPTHGPAVTEPLPFVKAYIAHRLEREDQLSHQLASGPKRIGEIVPVLYAAVDPALHPAAGRSLLSHLLRMLEDGRVKVEGEPGIDALWRLAA